MSITIFGATGATGRMLTQQALTKGYEIVAYVRNPTKLDINDKNLRTVQGDLSNQSANQETIKGSDVEINVLGPTGSSKGVPISKRMQLILQAVQAQT